MGLSRYQILVVHFHAVVIIDEGRVNRQHFWAESVLGAVSHNHETEVEPTGFLFSDFQHQS